MEARVAKSNDAKKESESKKKIWSWKQWQVGIQGVIACYSFTSGQSREDFSDMLFHLFARKVKWRNNGLFSLSLSSFEISDWPSARQELLVFPARFFTKQLLVNQLNMTASTRRILISDTEFKTPNV